MAGLHAMLKLENNSSLALRNTFCDKIWGQNINKIRIYGVEKLQGIGPHEAVPG
jgi:hypothetical protein